MHFRARRVFSNSSSFKSRLGLAVFILLLSFSLLQFPAIAATSSFSNFQGKIVLKDNGANFNGADPACVTNGSIDTCAFRISYFDTSSGGSSLYTEDFTNVELGDHDGIFSLSLGAGNRTGGSETDFSAVFSNHGSVYLDLEFDSTGTAGFSSPEIFTVDGTNRMPISAAPFALTANNLAAGNNQFIRNQTGVQIGANFNIAGTGVVGSDFSVDPTDNAFFVNSINHNVGIGTSDPQGLLHVYQNKPADLSIYTQNAYPGMGSFFINQADSKYVSNILKGDTQTWLFGMDGTSNFVVSDHTNTSAGTYPFQIESGAPTNAFYMNATGLIGIHTSNPNYLLDLGQGTGKKFSLWSDESNFYGFGFTTDTLEFYAGANTDNAAMVLRDNGRVGIGTNNPATALDVNGAATFGQVGIGTSSQSYSLELATDSAAKPGGGSWSNNSDARLKTDITPISNALDKLSQLNGVNFKWINPTEHGDATGAQGGFIAQDVASVFPNWVQEVPATGQDSGLTADGKVESLSLPFQFDALVVESIKELAGQVKGLQNSAGNMWAIKQNGDMFTSKNIAINSLAANQGNFNMINTNNISAVDLDVSGILSTNSIRTDLITANAQQNITVRLGDILGVSSFEVQNSDNVPLFRVGSDGNVQVLGKLIFSTDTASASVGSATLAEGVAYMRIFTTAASVNSKVFISINDANSGVFPQLKVASKGDGYFDVQLKDKEENDVSFDWWIIN